MAKILQPLKVLIVEDNRVDAELVVMELRRAGFDPHWSCADTEKDYLEHLNPDLDVIISDFDLPEFSGLRALELLNERAHEIPFIVVSGTIGEETAVKTIKTGATDYVLKDRINLLGPAVSRALQEYRERIERRNFQNQLLSKTALFEALAYSAIDGILVVDSNGKMIVQNQKFAELWHLPEELTIDKGDKRRLEWVNNRVKNPEQFGEKVAYLYAHPDEIGRDEIELIDGRFFDRHSAPVRGPDGQHYGRIWLFRDISERKIAEKQIAEQAALLDKAQDAIVATDLDNKILFWNKGAERVYGWTREDAIGREINGLISAETATLHKIITHLLEKGEFSDEGEHVAKDGRKLLVEGRRTLIKDSRGNPQSILVIYTDVTEKRKLEAQFMRAQRMESIGTLAGGMAHDLNNILAPILLSIEMLRGETYSPEAKETLDAIETSAKRGADIVRQVLSFARGVEGKRVQIQLKHLLLDLEKIIKDTFPKDICLKFLIRNDGWPILGDPTQVHQILLNLCVNARDAMPEGGALTVTVENCVIDEQNASANAQAKAGPYVQIVVTDTGTGIAPELVDKIFDPFFTTKGLNKGSGLGLSSVSGIVRSHNGFIQVESKVGRGSSFKVYLPATENSSEHQKAQTTRVDLTRGKGEMVLVVDDEAAILFVACRALQSYGYRTLKAEDGAEAIALFAKHANEIDVVVTDVMMPVMDGHALVRALRQLSPRVKIIAASGLESVGSGTNLTIEGANKFLPKPYTAKALLSALEDVLHKS